MVRIDNRYIIFCKKAGKHTLEVGDSVGSGDNEGEVSVESGVYEDSVEIGHRYCLRCC